MIQQHKPELNVNIQSLPQGILNLLRHLLRHATLPSAHIAVSGDYNRFSALCHCFYTFLHFSFIVPALFSLLTAKTCCNLLQLIFNLTDGGTSGYITLAIQYVFDFVCIRRYFLSVGFNISVVRVQKNRKP